jgi:hypothetical protein
MMNDEFGLDELDALDELDEFRLDGFELDELDGLDGLDELDGFELDGLDWLLARSSPLSYFSRSGFPMFLYVPFVPFVPLCSLCSSVTLSGPPPTGGGVSIGQNYYFLPSLLSHYLLLRMFLYPHTEKIIQKRE